MYISHILIGHLFSPSVSSSCHSPLLMEELVAQLLSILARHLLSVLQTNSNKNVSKKLKFSLCVCVLCAVFFPYVLFGGLRWRR